ncbi:winged helix-turn-helix domain-containing protein [Erwinia mallotivora]|uniref:winged helix-turn-helix domain-containing protein n=1 Tax=Erwinia mallotivora TaxID=69222 RepID=UPI0021BE8B00|nr:winged helix-turn-helix domain-containing protein [Erwinia mallotivora]
MNNYYIINDFLQFCTLSNRLTKLNEKNVYVTLNSPASRCLLMLIKQQGNIITQQEFMDEVWQKKGMFVGKNTYYQNISILRKTFKNIGMDEEIVITIPRIGLTLAQGVDIRSVPAEERKSLLTVSKKNKQTEKNTPDLHSPRENLPESPSEHPEILLPEHNSSCIEIKSDASAERVTAQPIKIAGKRSKIAWLVRPCTKYRIIIFLF